MSELLNSRGLILAITAFIVVALGTVAIGLLWEGVRRWLRAQSATSALRGISAARVQKGKDDAGKAGSLLRAEEGSGVPPWLEAIVVRLPHREDLQRLLDQAGIRALSIPTILMASVGIAVVLAGIIFVLTGNLIAALPGAALGGYIPIGFLKIKRNRRFAAFEEGFPDAIDLLARAARAGHSLASGLEVVSEEGAEPVASEFRQVFEEQRFGLPIQDALMGLADRVDIVDVRILVTAVLIQRESGGNLAESLDGLSSVIRGRFRFKRDVKTKTAHGRITGLVVAAAPVVAAVGMYLVNPEYMTPMFVEPLGRMMLGLGVGMMVMGFLVIRRMVDIKY